MSRGNHNRRMFEVAREGLLHAARHPLRSLLTALTSAIAIAVTVNVISLSFGFQEDLERDVNLLRALGIAVVASVAYVITWEVYLAATDYAFIREYTQSILAERANELIGAALQAEIDKMAELEAQYANPLYRLPITFLEILPVGLVVALVSAAVLRNSKVLPAHG